MPSTVRQDIQVEVFAALYGDLWGKPHWKFAIRRSPRVRTQVEVALKTHARHGIDSLDFLRVMRQKHRKFWPSSFASPKLMRQYCMLKSQGIQGAATQDEQKILESWELVAKIKSVNKSALIPETVDAMLVQHELSPDVALFLPSAKKAFKQNLLSKKAKNILSKTKKQLEESGIYSLTKAILTA